jgi:hypothetical protein
MNCNCCGGEMKKKSVVCDQSTTSGNFTGQFGAAGVSYGSGGVGISGMAGGMAGKIDSQSVFAKKCERPAITASKFIKIKKIVHESSIHINGWIAWPIISILIFSEMMWYWNIGFEDINAVSGIGFLSIMIGVIISVVLSFIDFNTYKDVSCHSSVYFDQKQAHDRWLHEWICVSCGKLMIDSEYIPSQKIKGMPYYKDYIHAWIGQHHIYKEAGLEDFKALIATASAELEKEEVMAKKQQSSKEIIKNNTEFSFLDSEGNAQGTYTGDQIKDLLQDGTITDNTQIYIHGKLFEWRELSTFNYSKY